MRKRCLLLSLIAAAALLTGCGSNDYSRYVTLGDYKDLSVELAVAEVTDEELAESEKDQLDSYTSYEDAEGPVKEGQHVNALLLAKDGDETVYDFTDDGYELTIGQKDFGEEVDEALIGKTVGDELDLSVSYDEDFGDMMLCGKEISFHIEIESIFNVTYPELTDEFVTEEFNEQSVEAWRDTMMQELRATHQEEAEEDMRDELVQQAVDGSQISGYPKKLYKQKREAVQAEYQSYAEMFGCSLDEVYEMLEVDEEQREKEYLDETYRTMVLAMIRQQENITLSDEQMQEKLEAYAQENEYDTVEDLLADYDREDLSEYFLNEMTIDFLEEHADIKTS